MNEGHRAGTEKDGLMLAGPSYGAIRMISKEDEQESEGRFMLVKDEIESDQLKEKIFNIRESVARDQPNAQLPRLRCKKSLNQDHGNDRHSSSNSLGAAFAWGSSMLLSESSTSFKG